MSLEPMYWEYYEEPYRDTYHEQPKYCEYGDCGECEECEENEARRVEDEQELAEFEAWNDGYSLGKNAKTLTLMAQEPEQYADEKKYRNTVREAFIEGFNEGLK